MVGVPFGLRACLPAMMSNLIPLITTQSKDVQDIDALNFNPTSRFIYTVYAETYEGINRSNIVLEQVDNGKNDLTDDEKKAIVAEAKFIRGFFHFLAAWMRKQPHW